jgi:hypothetical protein
MLAYTTISSNLVTSHSVNLTGLTPGVIYCYQVISTADGQNDAIGSIFRFGVPVGTCGDGAVQSGEQCDNGGANGVCPAVCSATCLNNNCAPLPPPPPPPPPPGDPFAFNLLPIAQQFDVPTNSIIGIINSIITWIFTISLPIIVILIIYAGILFLISRGDKDKIERARKVLWYALLGFAIILIGQGMVVLIRSILGG